MTLNHIRGKYYGVEVPEGARDFDIWIDDSIPYLTCQTGINDDNTGEMIESYEDELPDGEWEIVGMRDEVDYFLIMDILDLKYDDKPKGTLRELYEKFCKEHSITERTLIIKKKL